jgi:hypothetical protein
MVMFQKCWSYYMSIKLRLDFLSNSIFRCCSPINVSAPLLYKLKFLPHLIVEQIYYLNCLWSVIQKLSAQTWYIESGLTSILRSAKHERTNYLKKYKDVKNRDVCWSIKFKSCKWKTFYRWTILDGSKRKSREN